MRTVTRTLTLAVALVLLAASARPRASVPGEFSVGRGGDDHGGGRGYRCGTLARGTGRPHALRFTQDTDGTSTCTDDCAATWPPFTVEAGATVEAGEGVTGELAIIERDDGASQVTYRGMPLYFDAPDAEPSDATGQGVGDVWFIASPEGQAGAEPSDDAGTDEGERSPSYDYDY